MILILIAIAIGLCVGISCALLSLLDRIDKIEKKLEETKTLIK